MNLCVSAVLAGTDVTAKPAGFTVDDGTGCLELDRGGLIGKRVVLPAEIKDLLDFGFTHDSHRKADQKDFLCRGNHKKPDGCKLKWSLRIYAPGVS